MERIIVTALALALLVAAGAAAQVERQRDAPGPPGNVVEGTFIDDPGFEAGTPNPFWTEASTNFGTPLCDVPSCGTGTGTGPRSGSWWAWFGGIAVSETGSVSQSVTMPDLPIIDMTFWVEAIVCASPADFLELRIDGNVEWMIDGSSPLCGVLGYTQQSVDLSAYRNQTVDLEFFSISGASGNTNFFIDDLDIEADVPVDLQLFQVD